ncbi:MAG: hypothetical protein ACPHZ9_10005 [Neptunomonas phycophila]
MNKNVLNLIKIDFNSCCWLLVAGCWLLVAGCSICEVIAGERGMYRSV